ncbi:MAG: response regulator transcription factor [Candidatus Dormibacteraceae bacterium]
MKPTPADPTRVKVLVVDDEPMMVNFLRTGLRYEGFEVMGAGDGNAALELAQSFRPDIVILDLRMPGADGYEVCRRLRGDPDLGIIMLTAKDETKDRILGLDLGADDYLVKPFDFDELLSRMRALLRRLKKSMADTLICGPLTLDSKRRRLSFDGKEILVTARELELMTFFMQHPRQVLTRQLILDRVWGVDFYGSDANVEVYVGYLRTKLGDSGRNLIQTVRGVGYQLVT